MLIVYFTHKTIYFQSRLVLCVNCKMFLCIKIYISISHYNEPDIDVQVSIYVLTRLCSDQRHSGAAVCRVSEGAEQQGNVVVAARILDLKYNLQ